MKTIKENIENQIEIKNSKFITILIKISNNNISSYLEQAKEKYPKATHYCYAYIYNDDKKSSDDGEPGGTAGMPMLNVLEKEELNNILAITIRYFGGIKLGAGGLVRAYTKSITETLKQTEYIELIEGYKIEIKFPYTEEKQINYILKNQEILTQTYQEQIIYQALIPKELEKKLINYQYQISEKIYIEKKNS